MSWQITGRARVNAESPRAFGVCDRCQFLYNRIDLNWQYEWQFQKIHNKRILVCPTCQDKLQEQLRRIVLPVDPVPIANARVGEFGSMIISSNPNAFDTIVPSQLVVQGTLNITQQQAFQESGFQINAFQLEDDTTITTFPTQIGDRSPIVTELSSMPILVEVTNTMLPQGTGDDSYTQGPDANTPGLNILLGGNSS